MNQCILNVSTATQLCSEALCQTQGRCVRKHWDDDVYLTLDMRRYRIERLGRGGPLVVRGGLAQDDFDWFNQWFDCMCYCENPCSWPLILNIINEAVVTLNSSSAGSRVTGNVYVLLMGVLLFSINFNIN